MPIFYENSFMLKGLGLGSSFNFSASYSVPSSFKPSHLHACMDKRERDVIFTQQSYKSVSLLIPQHDLPHLNNYSFFKYNVKIAQW